MSSIEHLYNDAITELNLGNPKKALVILNRILQADPNHVDSLIRRGNIYGKFAKYAEAISSYDEALKITPKNKLALINKGLALHYLEKYDEAISCYDEILSERPDSAITLYNKASSLVRCGKTHEGLKILQRTIDLDYSYKYKARADVDFESIKKTNEFKHVVL